MNFHLAMQYPDGRVFNGQRDFRSWPKKFGLDQIDFSGLRVLDIATDEGFWAFWSEMQGASDVLAIDIEKGERYDWGKEKDQEWINTLNKTRVGKKAFDFHHANLQSKVRYEDTSIYDVRGEFDVVFNLGLSYHLRHPLKSIDNCFAMTKGFMFLETLIDDRCGEDKPVCWFYPGKAPNKRAPSNWSGASTACVTAYLKNAGFDHVYFSPGKFPNGGRRIFVAVVDEKYKAVFDQQKTLTYCTDEYWNRIEAVANW